MKSNDHYQQIDELFLFANILADTAKKITLSYFRKPINSDKKSDGSPVTIADKKTEKALRKKIESSYPDHSILGEEYENKTCDNDYEWIIDPIDGTKSFLSGNPLYGTLICLLYKREPVISLIDMPALGERFVAQKGKETQLINYKGSQVLNTSQKSDLSESICYSTDESMFSDLEKQRLIPLRKKIGLQRYTGDCYLYGMLSAGWIDLVIESDLKPYDFLPLVLVVEGAGGIITDWNGESLDKNSPGQVIAVANNKLHQKVLAELAI